MFGSICVAQDFPVNLLFPTSLWEFVDELWERDWFWEDVEKESGAGGDKLDTF